MTPLVKLARLLCFDIAVHGVWLDSFLIYSRCCWLTNWRNRKRFTFLNQYSRFLKLMEYYVCVVNVILGLKVLLHNLFDNIWQAYKRIISLLEVSFIDKVENTVKQVMNMTSWSILSYKWRSWLISLQFLCVFRRYYNLKHIQQEDISLIVHT